MEIMEKKRNATIDFVRVIASILVISIHTTKSMVAGTIGRWAVPFLWLLQDIFIF